MRRKPLTAKVARGLDHWYPVMDLLLCMPSDSELQERTDAELDDMRAAVEWIESVLAKREARAAIAQCEESPK